MKESDGFLEKLDGEIAERHLLKHLFYQTWEEGKLTLEALQGYAKQYYHYVKAFPTFISAVHSNCPDLTTRQMILENLMEEDFGMRKSDCGLRNSALNTPHFELGTPHPELWLRFGDALGLSREEMTNTPPLPETQTLVETFREITHHRSFVEGQAAVYAYESQVPEIGKTKVKGLKEHYNISDPRGLEFFTLHIEVDVEHAKTGKEIIEFGIRNSEFGIQEEAVIQSVRESLKALWAMLDGVHANFVE